MPFRNVCLSFLFRTLRIWIFIKSKLYCITFCLRCVDIFAQNLLLHFAIFLSFYYTNNFQWLAKHLGINQFLPSNKLLKYLAYDCELFNVNKEVCEDIIFVLCGFDKAEFNTVIAQCNLPKLFQTKKKICFRLFCPLYWGTYQQAPLRKL